MARKAPSQAERWREHRLLFEAAREMGCTPAEAREHLALREARERHAQAMARLSAKIAGHPLPAPIPTEPRAQPWWQRD